MNEPNYRLIATRQLWKGDAIAFHLAEYSQGGTRKIATQFLVDDFPAGHLEPAPLFQLGPDEAQALIDQLWDCGLRPTQGKQSEGVIASQARHLEDMRAIAFAKLFSAIEQPPA